MRKKEQVRANAGKKKCLDEIKTPGDDEANKDEPNRETMKVRALTSEITLSHSLETSSAAQRDLRVARSEEEK